MRGPNTRTFQQGFLKNMILSLQACSSEQLCISSSSSGGAAAVMNLHQKKCAIKSSADIAMATARGGGARWPQALLLASISPSPSSRPSKPSSPPGKKKIVRRRLHTRRRRSRAGTCASSSLARATIGSSREIARRLVRKRTKVLRKMIPGGELLLDEISLLHEAVDYVAHLHAQVDILRRISNVVVQRG